MKTKILGLIALLTLVVGLILPTSTGRAADKDDDTFELIPKAEQSYTGAAKDLGNSRSSGNFAEIYNQKAKSFGEKGKDGVGIKACSGLGEQFASGIMNRDTILCLAAQIVTFVSNMALVVGALMIIYAGYLYATAVFNGGNVGKGSDAIKRAIIGIVVVIFSYAILNLLINAFL